MPSKIKSKGVGDGSVYRFKIEAYSPDTMPMGRLAQYMAELAVLLGEKNAVHFRRLTKGSTILNAKVDREAIPKVWDRVAIVRAGEGGGEPIRAFHTLNRLLRDDNAIGVLRDNSPRGIIVRFPGRELAEEKFASIRQQGFVDGIVTGIRGKDDTIHITIQSEAQQISGCETNRSIAKQLGTKLFEPVRLFGRGRWSRDADGIWSLLHFRIESFDSLDDAPLASALAAIREIRTEWDDTAYGELTKMRRGPGAKRMVVIDATTLLLMLRPGTPVPDGPNGVPIDRPKDRIDYLVQQLDKSKTRIIIPAPALGEALVRAGTTASQQIVEHLQRFSVFSIEPFDTRAAIEVAAMSREALASGKKRGDLSATWAKVKYDRQIVAIAKVHGATAIYSDDGDIRTLGKRARINVISLAELPLPPQKAQMDLLEHAADLAKNSGENDEDDGAPPA